MILYIAVWFWQLFAIIFLCFSMVFLALRPRTLMSSAFYVALFLIFIGCEIMVLKRRKELSNGK